MAMRGRRTRRALEVGPCRASRQAAAHARRGRRGRRPPATREGAVTFRARARGARDDLHQARPDAVCRGRICSRTSTSRSSSSSSTTWRRSRSTRRAASSIEEIGLEIFARLDEQPLACASIAQIHGGLLRTGREVVVKVRRPADRAGDRPRPRVAPLADVVRGGALPDGAVAAAFRPRRRARDAPPAELDFVEEAHGSELIGRSSPTTSTWSSRR